MELSLEGVFDWLSTQAQYALFIVLIVIILITGAKRAWIAMISAIVGLAVVGIFILNPNIINSFATWVGGLLNIS